jgi:hypothetical protein
MSTAGFSPTNDILQRLEEADRTLPAQQPQYFGTSRRDLATDVYTSFRNQGFSHKQAVALTAEINRENSFNPNTLFGTHVDPHNRAKNVGMLSWQGPRADAFMKFMGEQGMLDGDGRIKQTPEALNAQAMFLRMEMETRPEYQKTRDMFLNNPDVDYDTAHSVLGDNYIRWRRTDPKYSGSGYDRINEAYSLLGGQIEGGRTPALGEKQAAGPQTLGERLMAGLEDLPDALQYLELPDSGSQLRPGAPPPINRGRQNTGSQALQRLGIRSLA